MTELPLPPIQDDAWPQSAEEMKGGFATQLNVYRTMAHNPALLTAWAPLRQHVVIDNALGQELSEVAILRTGHRFGSAYEWAHHVSRARKLGFSDARIAAIRDMPAGEDGLIVRAVDALIDDAIARTGASGMQDMGKVMGVLKPQLQGRADIGAASGKVKKRLTA